MINSNIVVKRLCRLFFDITLYQTLYYVGDILTCVFIEHEVHNICRITDFVFGCRVDFEEYIRVGA